MNNINPTTPQLTLAKNLFDGYISLDTNKITPFISKDYTFRTFPKITCHEAIEAPGKVVIQASGVCHTVNGNHLEYESVSILTIVEEDGELKVSEFKDFCNPEKRGKLHGWLVETMAKLAPQVAA